MSKASSLGSCEMPCDVTTVKPDHCCHTAIWSSSELFDDLSLSGSDFTWTKGSVGQNDMLIRYVPDHDKQSIYPCETSNEQVHSPPACWQNSLRNG